MGVKMVVISLMNGLTINWLSRFKMSNATCDVLHTAWSEPAVMRLVKSLPLSRPMKLRLNRLKFLLRQSFLYQRRYRIAWQACQRFSNATVTYRHLYWILNNIPVIIIQDASLQLLRPRLSTHSGVRQFLHPNLVLDWVDEGKKQDGITLTEIMTTT